MNCLKSRERGFTLVELLIVTVVIVTLMGIVFRLAGVGGDSRAKSKTLARLQRIENAISGYYAAYGSYPPVPLQGRSRDIRVEVNETTGVQKSSGNVGSVNLSNPDERTVRQVEAACRAQPVAVLFPFFTEDSVNGDRKNSAKKLVDAISREKGGNFSFSPYENPGGFKRDQSEWHAVGLFQFGLLSFLLPRYLFMLQGDPSWYNNPRGQWAANNQLPCQIDTGIPYGAWAGSGSMQEDLYKNGSDGKGRSRIENLPSQAVCARWMPNFEGIISGGLDFYGVDTEDKDWPYLDGHLYDGVPGYRKCLHQCSQRGSDGDGSLYLLNGMTIEDGWGVEFYYHSEVPYQSYRLWSAGPNRRTFPPWLDVSGYAGKALETISTWTKDDISHLSN